MAEVRYDVAMSLSNRCGVGGRSLEVSMAAEIWGALPVGFEKIVSAISTCR